MRSSTCQSAVSLPTRRYVHTFADSDPFPFVVVSAHKAAHPERYPVPDHVRKLMPCLDGIEDRYGPTKIHLQVYDGSFSARPTCSVLTR